ncbi:LytR/AlgR family response regulator transcription factor [Spirosoma gilvum]
MAITCIVVDDEEMSIEHLLGYIAKVPFLSVEGSFTDPTEAITYLENNSVALVFLDVEMPNFAIDGMDFMKIMGSKQHYILTTSYPQYALPSYDYDVVDFLCKPYPFDRFLKAVNKVRAMTETPSDEPDSDDHAYVRVDGKHQRIDFTEILWIESERNYVSIYTPTDRINLHIPISEIEEVLPPKLFVRVHKSYIVAKKRIDLIEKEQLGIKKEHQTKLIPIGEAYRKALMQAIFPIKKK